MIFLLRSLISALLVGAVLLWGRALAPAGEPIVLRFGTNAPEGSPWAEGSISVGRLIEKNTKGLVRLKIFPSGMLGDEQQMMQSLANGGVDGAAVSAAATFDYLPELAALELPYVFPDEVVTDRALERLYPAVQKAALTHGYQVVVYTSVGFRHLGTPRPIESLADLRKLRLRSQPSAQHARMWALLGVKHTPIGLPQVSPALDRREVDSFDAALVWMFGAGWHQHIKTLTLTGHIHQPGIGLLSPVAVAKIPENLRARLAEGSAAVARENVKRVHDIEHQLLRQLPEMGVEVRPPSPSLHDELERTLAPMRPEWRKSASPVGKKLLDAVLSEISRARVFRGEQAPPASAAPQRGLPPPRR